MQSPTIPSASPGKPSSFRTALCLCALAAAGVLAALLATSQWGIGVSPDSTVYLGAARSLLSGRGLVELTQACGFAPLATYPPLFPAVLAAIGAFGAEPFDGARGLNAILFGANILIVGIAILRHTRGSYLPALLGAFLILTSEDMLADHTMAWSEPLFVGLAMASLLLVAEFVQNRKPLILGAASAFSACAFLDRYVGLSLAAAGAVAILFLSDASRRDRLISALGFGAASSLPVSAWFLATVISNGGAGQPRILSLHPAGLVGLADAVSAVSGWLWPASVLSRFPFLAWVGFAIVAVLAIVAWLGRAAPIRKMALDPPQRTFLAVLLIFVAAYFLVVVLSMLLLDAGVGLNSRILSPLWAVGVVAVACLLPDLLAGLRPAPKVILIGCGLLFALSYGYRAFGFVRYVHAKGQMFTSEAWRESPVIRQLGALPDAQVYSNGYDAVYFLTGRTTCAIPARVDKFSLRPNPDFASEMADLANRLSRRQAFVVYFDTIDWRTFVPSENDLRQGLPLRVIAAGPDGTIYGGE